MKCFFIGTFSSSHYYIHAYILAAVRITLLVLNHNHKKPNEISRAGALLKSTVACAVQMIAAVDNGTAKTKRNFHLWVTWTSTDNGKLVSKLRFFLLGTKFSVSFGWVYKICFSFCLFQMLYSYTPLYLGP